MRTTIDKPENRDDWLDARRPYIGASEAAALVAEHEYLRLGELAARKLAGTEADETPAMRRGRYLEHAIALWYSDEHGVMLEEPDVLFVRDPFIATLDRIPFGSRTIVEIKSTKGYVSEIPRYWYWQAQVQLLCTGFDRVDIVALDASDELRIFPIEPDDEDQALVTEAAETFMCYIRRGEFPPGIALPYETSARLHPNVESTSIDLDDETARWVHGLACLQRRIKDLQEDENGLKGMIGHRLGDAAEGIYDGSTIVTWRSTTRHQIDAKRLRAEHPDIARDYTTESRFRQLRIINNEPRRKA